MTPRPPHRFREDQFRRYEHILKKVIANFPQATRFRPENFSTETCCGRIRDAVKAFRANLHWPSELDRAWFEEFWGELVVAHDGEYVTIKKRGEAVVEVTTGGVQSRNTSSLRLVIEDPHFNTIAACCVLLSSKVITEPVQINNLEPELESRVNALLTGTYHDLMLMPQQDKPNTFLLL